jgi:hypothetical protein
MAENVYDFTPTLDTSIYADNDILFDATEVKGVFQPAGVARALHSIVLLDGDDQNCDIDLIFSNASIDLGTVNGAVNVSDSDAAKIIGYVRLSASADGNDLINSIMYARTTIGLVMKPAYAEDSIWVSAVLRSGTPTYSASGMKIKLGFL